MLEGRRGNIRYLGCSLQPDLHCYANIACCYIRTWDAICYQLSLLEYLSLFKERMLVQLISVDTVHTKLLESRSHVQNQGGGKAMWVTFGHCCFSVLSGESGASTRSTTSGQAS